MKGAWRPPNSFEEYQLLRLLADGSMGEVYLAFDTLLEREVAVKFVSSDKLSETTLARFMIEARAAARIQHERIAAVYRVGRLGGHPYLVNEYLPGGSLEAQRRPMATEAALAIVRDLALGLAAAHHRGVLHRDIKLSNVMLTADGMPKLVDFGLARMQREVQGPALLRAVSDIARPPSETPFTPDLVDLPPAGGDFTPTVSLEIVPPAEEDLHAADDTSFDREHTMHPEDQGGRRLTQDGALLGTPDYMAPELWQGAEATVASDIYALGVVLYELLLGRTPFSDLAPSELKDATQRQPAPIPRRLPYAIRIVLRRCLHRDPKDRWSSAADLSETLSQLLQGKTQPIQGAPFVGLQPFDERHRAQLFGREADVQTVIQELREHPIVLVAGDSGVGKTSLCQAGVLPAIQEAILDGRPGWIHVRIQPGSHPMQELAEAIATLGEYNANELEFQLEKDPIRVARMLQPRLGDRSLLIYIDQLEELLTLSEPEQARGFTLLLQFATLLSPGLRVLASIRSDCLSRIAASTAIDTSLESGLVRLLPLGREQLRAVVHGPCELAGVRFEDPTVPDALIDKTIQTRGGLPILQLVLTQLWTHRDPTAGVVRAKTYEDLGGFFGVLSRHADALIEELRPRERAVARDLILNLITPQLDCARGNAQDLRLDQPDRGAVMEALVRGRIVYASARDGTGVYQLPCPALIQGSEFIQGWLEDEGPARIQRAMLSQAARRWNEGRTRGGLARLLDLYKYRSLEPNDLNSLEQRFLQASRRRVRRRFLSLVALISVFLGGFAVRDARQNTQQANASALVGLQQAQQARSLLRRADQRRAELLNTLYRGDLNRAESLYAQELQLRRQGRAIWSKAILRAEAVAFSHPNNPATQQIISEALRWEAEHPNQPPLNNHLAWIASHVGLERTELPEATLTTQSDGLSAWLERITGEEHRRVSSHHRLQPTEQLKAGDYQITIGMGSHFSTLPLHLSPGQQRKLALRPLLGPKPPSGFVFVPTGRSWMGTTHEAVRQLVNAVPPHWVHVQPFFIAQREVNFEDYLRFLDDLPPAAQVDMIPIGCPTVRLLRTEGRWVLELHQGRAQRMPRGEDQAEAGSGIHATRWLRWPVVGVSVDQAEAYLRWLSERAGLTGARMCTETEWLRAGRGADQRAFPWGDVFHLNDANTADQKLPTDRLPQEVGSHPTGVSPFGVDDMVGNAAEWTKSSFGPATHVLRGGSYLSRAQRSRLAARELDGLLWGAGIRVCISP